MTDFTMTPNEMVMQFHLSFNHPVASSPNHDDTKLLLLRAQLIQEEIGELAHAYAAGDLVEALDALTDIEYVVEGAWLACGLMDIRDLTDTLEFHPKDTADTNPETWERRNLLVGLSNMQHHTARFVEGMARGDAIEAAKGLAGIMSAVNAAYVTTGLEPYRAEAFMEVQRANMSKLGEDGKPILDGAGRVVKSNQYIPPNIGKIVAHLIPFG